MAYNSVAETHGVYNKIWIEVFIESNYTDERYKRTRQCYNILTSVPVCTIVLQWNKDIILLYIHGLLQGMSCCTYNNNDPHELWSVALH